jgi:putative phage-type endonuclease
MATTPLGLSEKQMAMRGEGLGASEVPTALGLNKYTSPAELCAVKRGELPAFEGNQFSHWGQRLERVIAEEYLERHREEGISIFTPPTIRHPTCPVLFATPDRVIVPAGRRAREVWQGLLEIKALSAYRSDEFDPETGTVPEPYIVQTQVQMEVCDLDRAVLVPLLGGNTYLEFPQVRDRELGGQLAEFTAKWWADHVVQGIPVPLDGSDASSAYLRKRFPVETAPELAPTDELFAMVAGLRAAKKATAEAEKAETLASNVLRLAIGEAAGITGFCTYKQQKGSTYTVTREPTRVLRLAKEK